MGKLLETPLDLLFPYQLRWVQDGARFKLGCWSRQTGKDFSTAAEMVRDCIVREGSTWMIAAPSERQAIESMAKCKEWAEAFEFIIEQEVEERDGPNTLLKSSEIQFGNGSRILAVPGRPDTVRGFSQPHPHRVRLFR
jgi:phage FluMu gp28-like protein